MTTSWRRAAQRAGAAVLMAAAGAMVAGSGTAAADGLPGSRARLDVLKAVSCSSTASCFAAGGSTVVTTNDAGAHWTVVASPPNVFDLTGISCWSATRCLVVGSGNGDAGAIYRTSDGGLTWRTLPAVLPGGLFFAISCPSRDTCVATGNSGAVFSTADGGGTWKAQFLPHANLINGIDCVSTTVCEAVGYDGGNGVQGIALRTTDGGRTWVVTQSLPAALTFPTGVACPSITVCTAVGQTTIRSGSVQVGVIASTTDGGASWHRQRVPDGYSDISAVACPQVGSCEAAAYGPHAIPGTVDGGRTWTPQGPRSAVLSGVTCVTPRICVAVGQTRFGYAAIYRTDDQGQSWERQLIGAAG